MAPRPSQLEIKTGSVERLRRDIVEYRKDIERQKIALEGPRPPSDFPGNEEYDLVQSKTALAETVAVLENTITRARTAVNDLEGHIQSISQSGSELNDQAVQIQLSKARDAVRDIKAIMPELAKDV